MRLHRHPHAEQRRLDFVAEQRLVSRIVWMRDQRDAGRNQLGTRRVDLDERRAIGVAAEVERDGRRAGMLAIFELGLRHRGLEVDVPQRRRLDLVSEPALQHGAGTPAATRAARRLPIVA
mgnify:CR=1 FL=1